MSAYAIRRRAEETTCEWCGFPLYVGDSALESADRIFCSSGCVSRYREALALRQDEDAAVANGTPID